MKGTWAWVIVAALVGAPAGLGGNGGCDDGSDTPRGAPGDQNAGNKPQPDGPGGTMSPGRPPSTAQTPGAPTDGAPGPTDTTKGLSVQPETGQPPVTQPAGAGAGGTK